MKEANIKKLREALNIFKDNVIEEEIKNYQVVLENDNADIKKIAMEICNKRGIDYKKLNKGFLNNLVDTITEFGTLFKNKESKIKKKMVGEIIYITILLVLLKIPFDLVRDIGYDYLEVLTTNSLYYTLWNVAFLVLYTVVFVCTLIVLLRNFNNKYR